MSFWIGITVVAMTGLAMLVIVVSRVAMRRIQAEEQKRAALEMQHQQQLLETNINAQEQERKKLAAELHDEVCSQLNVLKLQLYQHRKELTDAKMLLQQVDHAIETSRNISHGLFPPMLSELGLSAAMQAFLSPIRRSFAVDFFQIGNEPHAHQPSHIHVFRIVQELTSNALKHAAFERISVTLKYTDSTLSLVFSDDGKGYDEKQTKPGLGMQTIESRVQILNGKLKVKTSPQHGTRIILSIPTT